MYLLPASLKSCGLKYFIKLGGCQSFFQKHPLGKASIKIMLSLTKIKNTLEERIFEKKIQITREERPPEK